MQVSVQSKGIWFPGAEVMCYLMWVLGFKLQSSIGSKYS